MPFTPCAFNMLNAEQLAIILPTIDAICTVSLSGRSYVILLDTLSLARVLARSNFYVFTETKAGITNRYLWRNDKVRK